MEPIRILLADDHLAVRAQIRARLSHEPAFAVVAEADNSKQAIECTLASRPDIVIMDPMMRDGMGIEAVRQIVSRLPDTVVVILTAFSDTAQQIELRRAGIRHILNKGIESKRLLQLLKDIGKCPDAGLPGID